MLFCKLLSAGSLLITVYIPCEATQERQSWEGRPAGKGECLGGGPFIPLTRSLSLTKYRPSLMTLWGVGGPLRDISIVLNLHFAVFLCWELTV